MQATSAVTEFANANDFSKNGEEGIEVKVPAMLVFRHVTSEQDLLDRVNHFYQGQPAPKDGIIFSGDVNCDFDGIDLV